MRRHPSLRELSVDHHHALVQSHRLQKVTAHEAAELEKVVADFLIFWEHATIHFREEDEALLPFFARYGDLDQESIRQMQREHVTLRRDVEILRATSPRDVEAIHALGHAFEAHVRLEERIVFPLIEAALPATQFAPLLAYLENWRVQNNARGVNDNEVRYE